MSDKVNFTQEELQLIYTACISYAEKLVETIKCIPNEEEFIRDAISNKANKLYRLARKMTEYMEE